MIQGATISLREWREADVPVLTTLRNDIPLQAQLLARPRGSNPDQVRAWLTERAQDRSFSLLVIVESGSDEAIGYVQLSDLGSFDRNAELGICLRQQSRGRGRGLEAINLVAAYARSTWAVRKLMLRVRADNEAAVACYLKAGFRKCGLLGAHTYIDGAYRDIVMMEKLLDDHA